MTRQPTLRLPTPERGLEAYGMHEPAQFEAHPHAFQSRSVFAAPHVVADARADYTPGVLPPVDWDATMQFRRHLWSYGIGVAEGMDTSERGPGGLQWPQAKELISYGIETAKEVGGEIVCGVGTDQIEVSGASLAMVLDAYLEQLEHVEGEGGAAVIRASHALVKAAGGADDFVSVYTGVLRQAQRPVIVHWLGTVFDPLLEGYWGSTEPSEAMETVLDFVHDNKEKIRGVKFSLLDSKLEQVFRARVPEGVEVFTGDDYDYTDLLLGDGERHSHGLLGILDPIAPIASQGFAALDRGDEDRFREHMDSTIPFAVKMFEPPASYYKVGVVFIAWLSGHQDHFRMVTGREGFRSLLHLTDLFKHADGLGLFPDADLAAHRMRAYLATHGIE